MRFFIFILIPLFLSCNRGEIVEFKTYLNHNDTVKYVGKEQCKICHYEIYSSYMETGMGRSISPASRLTSNLSSNPSIIYDSVKNLSYLPLWKDDSLWIKEFRIVSEDTVHKIEKKVDYIIGSGHHTNSHLFKINGYLHQMPYTYYTQDSISDLPPGYENGNNSRFSREINMECISCHNAYPNHVAGSNNMYHHIPDGIDCERCHGPGELHVKQKSQGIVIDTSKYIDYSIVNPSRLPTDLQFDVCQRCHLQGTAILHDNKSFKDFKPGMHLNDFIDVYLPKYKNDDGFIMASHVERLKQSECFKNSDMTCINCHNPHKSIRMLNNKYFDKKCMDCHKLCEDEQNISNCASCHMPNSSSIDIPHISITDHNISIPKKDKYIVNKKTDREFIGLFAINNNNSSNLSKSMAYLKRYESFEQNPIYLDSAFFYLSISDNNKSFTSFIQYYYLKKDYYNLINYHLALDSSIYKYYSDDALSLAFSRIGDAYAKNGIIDEGVRFFIKATDLSPFVIDYKLKLVALYINNDQFEAAENIISQIMILNPNRKEAYLNMGYLNILRQDYDQAEYNLTTAISFDPDYLIAYENLALLYIKKNDIFLARKNLNHILEINPNNAKAKLMIKQLN